MIGPTEESLTRSAVAIARRRPCVGLALAVVRPAGPIAFGLHGLGGIATRAPVTPETVFRIGSITKTMTAIAVLQLRDRGLIDLDAPAQAYLRAYRLGPGRPGFRPATVRHLLTHTAGIGEVRRPSGLLRLRDLGETVRHGAPVPGPAEYYRGHLRIHADPGTRFMYTNHGFVTLGQIVADVTGVTLDRYLRENVFEPLGMRHTDLERSDRVRGERAIGYELRRRGATMVADYDVITAAAGGVWSTAADVARYASALLGGGRNEHGSILPSATVAEMFAPHYQPDPRVPGIGLAFFRADLGSLLAVEHDGVLPGFDAHLLLVPAAGAAVVALANGARRGLHWLGPEVAGLIRNLLDLPDPAARHDAPHHPEVWADLCGRYRLSAYATDPARLFLGAGAEVLVRRGQLVIRFLSPVPMLLRGMPLRPDDPGDPFVFRADLPFGGGRVVFSGEPGSPARAVHLDLGPLRLARSR
ncbi:serine hydrolase domain-containing protein [Actinoplanes sp. NPDC049596]|uniref:serine hydrolase domain-containing protein n=1 Tax=unclassified Actinoplanes TaxID=2626549 RepID=UPI00341D1A5E